MDYEKKDTRLFDEASAKKQMAEAFSNSPHRSNVILNASFKLPTAIRSSRKVQATYTIRPEIKQEIESLAATQGFRSSSAFVDLVLEQVLHQAK